MRESDDLQPLTDADLELCVGGGEMLIPILSGLVSFIPAVIGAFINFWNGLFGGRPARR